MTDAAKRTFLERLWDFYAHNARHDMPWRQNPSAYNVLVSEVMLQQTSVARVTPKFHEFMARFPTLRSLADSDLATVLAVWNGLGYNRRARFLWLTAQAIQSDFDGVVPRTISELTSLPGIGKNTAGAMMAYIYDEPSVFVETNIRTVILHHFFQSQSDVSDADIASVLEELLAGQPPREFYWAMMDYGASLKARGEGRNDASRHYKKQSAFQGSVREVRGEILRRLLAGTDVRVGLEADERFAPALEGLVRDKLIFLENQEIRLTDTENTRDNRDNEIHAAR